MSNDTKTYTLTDEELLLVRFGLVLVLLLENEVTDRALELAQELDVTLQFQQELASL